jgi:hypothetical protein
MSTHDRNNQPKGFEFQRTPTGEIDYAAYQARGRREQAKAVAAAFSWLNDRVKRAWKA